MNNKKGIHFGSFCLAIFFIANVFIVPIVLLKLLDSEGDIETSSFLTNQESAEFLEIKVPMALSYVAEWDSPKKDNGLLESNGEFYTLLEKNFKNDTLYFKFVRNTNAREIFSFLSGKVDAYEHSPEKSQSESNSLISQWMFLKFKINESDKLNYLNIFIQEHRLLSFSYLSMVSSSHLSIDTPPPRFI
jgi:hypothetical protein